jgi:hypothetical protein
MGRAIEPATNSREELSKGVLDVVDNRYSAARLICFARVLRCWARSRSHHNVNSGIGETKRQLRLLGH